MSSPIRTMTTRSNSLPERLEQIGLHAVAGDVDDFLARATKQRWSPRQILEHLWPRPRPPNAPIAAWNEGCGCQRSKKFKPMADFDWSWPKKIERDVIERALTLDFLPEARNLVLVGTNGLGKTMIAQNICHAACWRATPSCSAPQPLCWKNSIARAPKAASASCVPKPTWDSFAWTRSGTCPSTTSPPTCSTR
ncbi:MAG TPA: ATP-binding protein [Terracidiphilus sp.]|jgi:hypothetical protein|nr:ATP-binding protein [Terracidiphilus sp.]